MGPGAHSPIRAARTGVVYRSKVVSGNVFDGGAVSLTMRLFAAGGVVLLLVVMLGVLVVLVVIVVGVVV